MTITVVRSQGFGYSVRRTQRITSGSNYFKELQKVLSEMKISVYVLALLTLSACDPFHQENYHFVDLNEHEKKQITNIIYEMKTEYGCDNDRPSNMQVCGGEVYFDPKTSTVSLSQLPSEFWKESFRPEMKNFSNKLYKRLKQEFPDKIQIVK